MTINESGTIIQERIFDHWWIDKAYAVSQTKDEDLLVAGFVDKNDPNTKDFYLMKVNLNGDTLWTKTATNFLTDECYNMILASNGYSYLVGYNGEFNIQMYAIDTIKITSVSSILLYPDLNTYYIEVFPNPVKGIVNIGFHPHMEGKVLNIYSIDGIKFDSFELLSSPTQIDVSRYKSGLYLVGIKGINKSNRTIVIN